MKGSMKTVSKNLIVHETPYSQKKRKSKSLKKNLTSSNKITTITYFKDYKPMISQIEAI